MSKDAVAGPTSSAKDDVVLDTAGLRVVIGKGADATPIVHGVDLRVRRGEVVALLGESGSGKSVTARALMGLQEDAVVTAERLVLGSTDLLTCAPEQRRRLRGESMSLVLQDALSALNPVLTIGDQIGELIRAHRALPRAAARGRAAELLTLVGIPSASRRIDDYPHQFSGGMRQRILIAMAIALEPRLLIADEPTTALDVTVQAQILDLLERLRRELGMGVLLITHDLGVVMEVADRVCVMYAGRIVEAGEADSVLTRPAHPYTEALLRSIPQGATRGEALFAIPGSPPNPATHTSGCAFAPRCHMVIERCRSERPPLAMARASQVSACFRTEDLLHDVA
ncbi:MULTISPECIES: ABC transporter ATP-binding protein [unclassified Microbacterium]|uniref:ABC transporter ATP-binding protein n=1 Tax=unclassified Microbacterium TaxID=2609290 RepID=UPI003010161D